MKRIGTCLTVLMLCASLAHATTENPDSTTAVGQIVSVDSAAKSVVVKVESQRESRNVTFVVAHDSKILKNGESVALSDLAQGDKVTVAYRVEGGKNVVVSIGVASKT